MSRGVEKQAIYRSDEDRRVFLALLTTTAREHGISLFAYCLMGNHFHILLAIADTPLAISMQKFLTCYSLYFNRVHERSGHVFESRYKAEPCEDLAYLIQLTAYIHRNPVRAGLVAKCADWPWSSHAEFLNPESRILDFSRLEDICDITPEELRTRYLERIENADSDIRPELSVLLKLAASTAGVHADELTPAHRSRAHTNAKRLFIDWASEEGYSDILIASALNCSRAAVSMFRSRNAATS